MLHHRKNSRLPSSYTARVEVPSVGLSTECWVKDVSLSGLKLLGLPHLETGTRISVTADQFTMSGTVRWSREQKVGIALDRNLGQDEMAVLRHMRSRVLKNTGRRFDSSRFREMR